MSLNLSCRIVLSLILAAACLVFATPDTAQSCDLEAQFIAPTGNTLTGGQSVTWTVRFKNNGKSQCAANKIALYRYSGSTASGYGTAVGGSRNLKALPALNPGQTVELSFEEKTPPQTGTFTYKMRYSSPHNDSNNFNHHPTKTVTYAAAPAPTGPPDLIVESAIFTQGPSVGNCNTVKVTVKNQGSLANVISRATVIVFPTATPLQNRFEKHVFFSSFLAGQSQVRDVTGINIAAGGAWTMQVVADSQQQITEANENNNVLTQTNINVTQSCP